MSSKEEIEVKDTSGCRQPCQSVARWVESTTYKKAPQRQRFLPSALGLGWSMIAQLSSITSTATFVICDGLSCFLFLPRTTGFHHRNATGGGTSSGTDVRKTGRGARACVAWDLSIVLD